MTHGAANIPFLLAITATILLHGPQVSAQARVSVGFYNTENLFDTIPSPFHDDADFTPEGRYRWNSERYAAKLANIAKVIDDAGFDIIAIAEVENETVVRDLVCTLSDDYSYIHRNSGDSRGIDIALLYKGDKFFPTGARLINSGTAREFLLVSGTLAGYPVNILACHMPSKLNPYKRRAAAAMRLAETADSLLHAGDGAALIVMGDFNGTFDEKPLRTAFAKLMDGHDRGRHVFDPLAKMRDNGAGSYRWEGYWLLYDNILLSSDMTSKDALHLERAGIFIRPYMLTGENEPLAKTRRAGYPLRTFAAGRYMGGYSDHLPVFVILSR